MKKLNAFFIPFAVLGLLTGCGKQNNSDETNPAEEEQHHEEEHHEEEHHEGPPAPTVKANIAKNIKKYDSEDNLLQDFSIEFDEKKREMTIEDISYYSDGHLPSSRDVIKDLFDENMNIISFEETFYDGLSDFCWKNLYTYEYNEKGSLLKEEYLSTLDENQPATDKEELTLYTYDSDDRMTSCKYYDYSKEKSEYILVYDWLITYEEKKITNFAIRYRNNEIYSSEKTIYYLNDLGQYTKIEEYFAYWSTTDLEPETVTYFEYSTGDNGSLIVKSVKYDTDGVEETIDQSRITEYITEEDVIEQRFSDANFTELISYSHVKSAFNEELEYYVEKYYADDVTKKTIVEGSFSILNGLIQNRKIEPDSGDRTYTMWENEFDEAGRLTKSTKYYSPNGVQYSLDSYMVFSDYAEIYDEAFAYVVRENIAYYLY